MRGSCGTTMLSNPNAIRAADPTFNDNIGASITTPLIFSDILFATDNAIAPPMLLPMRKSGNSTFCLIVDESAIAWFAIAIPSPTKSSTPVNSPRTPGDAPCPGKSIAYTTKLFARKERA